MAERKPRDMSFGSWIDQQVADAERRGVFANLPGAGKPLDIRPEGGDYGQAWVRDYARREGVPPEELLPAPLRLRREAERLAGAVPEMGSEREVREAAGELNRRILDWRRIPVGPPVFVRLVDADEMARRWRAAQAARRQNPAAQAAPDGPGAPGGPVPDPRREPPPARRRRWRGRGRGGTAGA